MKWNSIFKRNICMYINMNKLHLLNVAIKRIYVFKDEWASNNLLSFFFTLCFHKYLYFHDNKYCLCLMWFHIQYLLNVLKVRHAMSWARSFFLVSFCLRKSWELCRSAVQFLAHSVFTTNPTNARSKWRVPLTISDHVLIVLMKSGRQQPHTSNTVSPTI